MSTKKEEITITELQTKVEKQFKLLNTMHYQNEKMINGNADNINEAIAKAKLTEKVARVPNQNNAGVVTVTEEDLPF